MEPTSASQGGSSSRPLHVVEARSNILAEIVPIQELYRQYRDVCELWQHLLTSVLARSDDVMVAPEAGAGLLGMPLVVADRILGVVGLAGPPYVMTHDTAEMLHPLVGVVAAIVESSTNATQRDAVTERLQRNLGLLEAVVGNASHGVVVVDPHGTIELANEAALALLGTSSEALAGDSIGGVMSQRAVDWVLSQLMSPSMPDPITRRTVQTLSHSGVPFRADVTLERSPSTRIGPQRFSRFATSERNCSPRRPRGEGPGVRHPDRFLDRGHRLRREAAQPPRAARPRAWQPGSRRGPLNPVVRTRGRNAPARRSSRAWDTSRPPSTWRTA